MKCFMNDKDMIQSFRLFCSDCFDFDLDLKSTLQSIGIVWYGMLTKLCSKINFATV